MSSNGEDIIRETFEKLGDAIGVQMQMPDATIANLGAVLQAEIDRIEAVETESFEFLNELALAFRAAENHPRPQYAPVLEVVRAVLAHLTASGRLLRDDEMRLTAEQVGWVSLIVNDSNPMSLTLDAWERVRALFPATEPASYCSKGVCSANEGHDGTCAEASGWAHDAYEDDPARAVPAEEETKAEAYCGAGDFGWLCTEPADHGGRHMAKRPKDGSVYHSWPTSSPVVPAPSQPTPAGTASDASWMFSSHRIAPTAEATQLRTPKVKGSL